MENNEPLIVEMTDERGEKVKVEIVRRFSDNNKNYVIANDLSNDTDSYILELNVIDGTDNVELRSIDDEAEFERLCKVVDDLNNDGYSEE